MAGTDLFNLLSSNVYLHSNTDNFLLGAEQLRVFTPSDLPWYQSIKKDLDDLIDKCEQIEAIFYNDMGVSGPKDFEQKYLMSDEKYTPGTINNIVGHIINSQSFVNFLRAEYKEALYAATGQFIDKYPGYVIDLGGRETLETRINSLYTILNKNLITKIPKNQIRDTLTFLVVNQTKNFVTDSRRKCIRYLKEEFKKGSIYNDQLTDKQINIFIDRFKKEINKSLDASSLSSLSGATGYVLEILFPILFGDEWINQGNEAQDGIKVAADLKVAISQKSGKEFLIQLKNSLNDSPFGNIKIQDNLNYQTLSNRVGEYNSDIQNEMDYLVGNIVFLRSYGLNKEGQQKNLSLRNVDGASDFLKYIFNSILATFLSEEITSEGLGEIQIEPKNNFFIYKGKYLIPMSSFFKSAKNVVENTLTNLSKNDSLGLVQIPAIEELTSTSGPKDNIFFRDKKLSQLRNLSGKELNYPEQILSIGRGEARNVAFGIKTKGFRYSMSMENLKEGIFRYV